MPKAMLPPCSVGGRKTQACAQMDWFVCAAIHPCPRARVDGRMQSARAMVFMMIPERENDNALFSGLTIKNLADLLLHRKVEMALLLGLSIFASGTTLKEPRA